MNGNRATRVITDGSTIASDHWAHGIRVNVAGAVGSVKFTLRGPMHTTTSTENMAGYDLFHTAADGESIGRVWKKGTYTLTVRLFSGTNGRGHQLNEETLHFTIV